MWFRHAVLVGSQSAILLLRSRMVLVLALLAASTVVMAFVLPDRFARRVHGDTLYGIATYMLFIQFALPFTMLFLAVASVYGDLEDRTATYLFVRPVNRISTLLGKWSAVTAVGLALIVLTLVLNWLALVAMDRQWRLGRAPGAEMLRVFLVATLIAAPAYAAVASACAVLFRRPLVWGVVFILGWEVLASNTPPEAGVRGATIAEPVRRFVLDALAPDRGDPLHRVLAGALQNYDLSGLPNPIESVAWLAVLALALAVWVYARREYESRQRD